MCMLNIPTCGSWFARVPRPVRMNATDWKSSQMMLWHFDPLDRYTCVIRGGMTNQRDRNSTYCIIKIRGKAKIWFYLSQQGMSWGLFRNEFRDIRQFLGAVSSFRLMKSLCTSYTRWKSDCYKSEENNNNRAKDQAKRQITFRIDH